MEKPGAPRPRSYCWAELMRRVSASRRWNAPAFPVQCTLAATHPPEAIREILDSLGLLWRAPPIARAVSEDADEPDI